MIIVSGLHRKSGRVRTRNFMPGREGAARNFRATMRSAGYNTVFVNDVADRYANREMLKKYDESEPFAFEGISGYQLHSLGTSGTMKACHLRGGGTDTLTAAIEHAESKVDSWSEGHKGIVIYRAIKLVRRITKPSTEVVELS